MKRISVHSLREEAPSLRAGQRILLSGMVYTSRDAVHKRIAALLDAGQPMPYRLQDAVIYYAGATPAPQGLPIGACGPTTSCRMDGFTPRLYDLGVVATIGKGGRSAAVADAIVRNGGVYLCAVGGAGALAAACVQSSRVIAFDDLGCEAVKELVFCDFHVIVAIDAVGGNLFADAARFT